MSWHDSFSRLHARLRSVRAFQHFTLLCRTLLILGFVSPGLTKVRGMRFATGIDPSTAVGGYFEAFFLTGGYYAFVGWVQVVAGLLLLSRRTALLGALLFFPVIGNIAILTLSLPFGMGTPLITGLMTLACTWLLVWDAHRLVPLLSRRVTLVGQPAAEPPLVDMLTLGDRAAGGLVVWLQRAGYLVGFAGLFTGSLLIRGHVPRALAPACGVAIGAAVLLTLLGWAGAAWRRWQSG